LKRLYKHSETGGDMVTRTQAKNADALALGGEVRAAP